MKRPLLIAGIVVGTLLALGPFWGMLGTMLGMMRAFTILGNDGISDPRALSGAIGHVLVSTAAGMVACPIGIVLLAVCIVLLVQSKKQLPPPPLPAGPTAQ